MSQLPANLVGLHLNAQMLTENPSWVFVFGDNTLRRGLGGAAKLRYHPQSYGFITKKYPTYEDSAFYKPEEYKEVYKQELEKLKKEELDLYKVIKKRYPLLSDDAIKLEIQNKINI